VVHDGGDGFVMPPTGALFTMVLSTIFLRGSSWAKRLFSLSSLATPIVKPICAPCHVFFRCCGAAWRRRGNKPHWLRAVLAELNPIGVFVTLAFLSWRYDNWLMIKALLVCFGVSLVVRALLPAGTLRTRLDRFALFAEAAEVCPSEAI
jgi:hypothetical protein